MVVGNVSSLCNLTVVSRCGTTKGNVVTVVYMEQRVAELSRYIPFLLDFEGLIFVQGLTHGLQTQLGLSKTLMTKVES